VPGAQLPWINFLVLDIVGDGVAYLLLWTLLPKVEAATPRSENAS
jgi:hypothetical protein